MLDQKQHQQIFLIHFSGAVQETVLLPYVQVFDTFWQVFDLFFDQFLTACKEALLEQVV